MGPAINFGTVWAYSGATRTLTNELGTTSFSPALSTTCSKSAVIQVSNNGNWRDAGDAFWGDLLSSFSSTSTSVYSTIVFKPNETRFNLGISTSSVTVPIRIAYSRTITTAYYNFNLVVFPMSSVVALCRSQANSIFAKTGVVGNRIYIVGDAALVITPTTFTASAPVDSVYGNTNLPKCTFYTYLNYSIDGGTTWNAFPMDAVGATFWSKDGDTSCIKSINPVTLSLSIYCTDITKFADTKTVFIRYNAWWNKVED